MSTGTIISGGLAIGGAVIGGIIGGPAGAAIGFTLGNAVGGIFFGDSPQQNQTIQGPRLGDVTISTSTYGKGIPIVFGSVRVPGNMIWATDIVEVKKEETSEQGGGGKGAPSPPTQTTVTFEYFGGFAMSFGEGEGFVRRMWADGKLIVDLSDEFPPGTSRRFKYGGDKYRFYIGNETQLPDKAIQADKGVANTPAFRGLIYVVFDGLPLKDFGNRIPQISAEIVSNTPTSFEAVQYQTGESFSSDGSWIDVSGRTRFGFNPQGGSINVYNRINGNLVDRFAINSVDNMVAQADIAGLPGSLLGFSAGRGFTHNETGMQVWALNFGNNGGAALHIGVLGFQSGSAEDSEHPWRKLKDGFWQVVRSSDSTTGLARVFRIGGALWFFGGQGLVSQDRLDAAPFIPFNIFNSADPTLQLIVQAVRTTATASPGGSPSGVIDPEHTADAVLTTANWEGAAYDPVNERAWFYASDNSLVRFDSNGFSTVVDMNTVLDPLHTSGGVFEIRGIAYDTVNEVLVVMTVADHFLVNPDDITTVVQSAGANVTTPISGGAPTGQLAGFVTSTWFVQETVDGIFHTVPTTAEASRWSTDDITQPLQRYVNPDDITGATWDWTEGTYYDPMVGAFWSSFGTFTQLYVDRFTADPVAVSEVLQNLVSRSKLLDGVLDTDVTEVTDLVDGYLIDNPSTIRSMIEPLQNAFFFDGAEIDGLLKFKDRSKAEVATITSEELGVTAAGGGQSPQQLVEPRKQESEVPRIVDVSYLNRRNDYQIGSQRAQRIGDDPANAFAGTTQSQQVAQIRLPMNLTNRQARRIAQKALSSAWVERNSLQFVLPPKFMTLDPTDVVVVQKVTPALTADLRVRLVNVEMGQAGIVACTGLFMNTAVFEENEEAEEIDGNGAGPIPYPVNTNMFLLNLPSLRGFADEDGAAWWGAAPDIDVENPEWQGAILFRRLSPNDPATQVGATTTQLLWGLTTTALAAQPRFTVVDHVSTLDVRLQAPGALSSITDLQFFAGGNLAFVPATGELLQFQNATLNADGSYTLDTFLRGRIGTEVFSSNTDDVQVSEIPVNSEVLLLGDLSALNRFSSLPERGLTRTYEATTIGGGTGAPNETEVFTNTAASLLPLSPADFLGTRDGSGNLDLTWKRRDRLNAEWLDLVDVPLNEVGEAYEIDVVDNPGPGAAQVIRTFIGLLSPSFEYLLADQQADFAHDTDFPLDISANVTNNGFEDLVVPVSTNPSIPGWDGPRTGTIQALRVTGAFGGVVPDTGSLMVVMDVLGSGSFSSDPVRLGGGTPPWSVSNVDTQPGRFEITATIRTAALDFTSATSSVDIVFLDADQNIISTTAGTLTTHAVVDVFETKTTGPVAVPVGARYVRLVVNMGSIGDLAVDAVGITISDTNAAANQSFTFDVYQVSATVGKGRGRRTIVPPVGQDQS